MQQKWMTGFLDRDATITIQGVWSHWSVQAEAAANLANQIKQGQSDERKNTTLTSPSPLMPHNIWEKGDSASIPRRCDRI
jgi:hypothetical protein